MGSRDDIDRIDDALLALWEHGQKGPVPPRNMNGPEMHGPRVDAYHRSLTRHVGARSDKADDAIRVIGEIVTCLICDLDDLKAELKTHIKEPTQAEVIMSTTKRDVSSIICECVNAARPYNTRGMSEYAFRAGLFGAIEKLSTMDFDDINDDVGLIDWYLNLHGRKGVVGDRIDPGASDISTEIDRLVTERVDSALADMRARVDRVGESARNDADDHAEYVGEAFVDVSRHIDRVERAADEAIRRLREQMGRVIAESAREREELARRVQFLEAFLQNITTHWPGGLNFSARQPTQNFPIFGPRIDPLSGAALQPPVQPAMSMDIPTDRYSAPGYANYWTPFTGHDPAEYMGQPAPGPDDDQEPAPDPDGLESLARSLPPGAPQPEWASVDPHPPKTNPNPTCSTCGGSSWKAHDRGEGSRPRYEYFCLACNEAR